MLNNLGILFLAWKREICRSRIDAGLTSCSLSDYNMCIEDEAAPHTYFYIIHTINVLTSSSRTIVANCERRLTLFGTKGGPRIVAGKGGT